MTKMPDPVAAIWWEDRSGGRQMPVLRLETWPPFDPLAEFDALITTTQAEAYARDVRREALLEAAQMCEDKFDFCGDELIVADAIRAMIDKEPA